MVVFFSSAVRALTTETGKKFDRLNSIKAAKVKIDLLGTYSVPGTAFIWLTLFPCDETLKEGLTNLDVHSWLFLFKFVLSILETKYVQSSDPEVKRCIVKVIGEFNKLGPAAATEDNPASFPPPKSEAPTQEIHAVRKVTTAEYQTRLLEYKV